MKIEEFSGRSNNLSFLKFIAAIMVIYGHSYVITGNLEQLTEMPFSSLIDWGGTAVAFFFFASGFFVTKSLLTRKNNKGPAFVAARAARIYPAFLFVVFITVFLMGPIVSECTAAEYFTSKQTYAYLLYLVMIPRYVLPGVFENNPLKNTVNGSLWTLVLEAICYMGLYIADRLRLLRRDRLKKLNWLAGLCILIVFGIRPNAVYQFHVYLRPLFLFLIGCEFYLFRDRITLNGKWGAVIAIVGIGLYMAGYRDLFMVCILPYLFSAVIFSKKQISSAAAFLGNYSYAMYLTAFPIQQILVSICPMGVFFNTFMAAVLSFLVSIPVYHFIEKPFLNRTRKLHKAGEIRYDKASHSFVLCAYGESPYLEECVRSVLDQTIRGSVCIATSTPNEHIAKIAEKYSLPVFVNRGEKGIAADWNFAVGCAKTPLVTLAHQDDVYSRDYVSRVLEALNRCSHPLIAFTDYYEIRNGETVKKNRLLRIKRLLLTPLKRRALWKSRFVRRRILSLGSAICCPSVTLVKENLALPVFKNNMKSNIDWQAWEEISGEKGEFAYVAEPSMMHRIHEDSTTSEIIAEKGRRDEDLMMYRKFWPRGIAWILEKFYQTGEKSNKM